ncbi:MAG: hypothetical protein BMS9Abin02_0035 [Anaerolineae bacterium]|nr:MAG: hypothetical protein BMS9Abin02_0035 [Anaerolineae bacterium]
MSAVRITPFYEGSIYSNFGEEVLEVTLANNALYPSLRIGSAAFIKSIWI